MKVLPRKIWLPLSFRLLLIRLFHARDIFALGEELRQLTRKDADVFELRELNTGTPFYNTVMQEGVRIA